MPCARSAADGAAALVRSDSLLPLTGSGAVVERKKRRAINALMLRQDFSGPFAGITRPMLAAGRTELGYVAATARGFRALPEGRAAAGGVR